MTLPGRIDYKSLPAQQLDRIVVRIGHIHHQPPLDRLKMVVQRRPVEFGRGMRLPPDVPRQIGRLKDIKFVMGASGQQRQDDEECVSHEQ